MAMGKGVEEIRAVKDRHEASLLQKKNVVGLGIGYKEVGGQEIGPLSLVVMVRNKESPSQLDATDMIPSEIEGVPVDVKEVGEIVALPPYDPTRSAEDLQTSVEQGDPDQSLSHLGEMPAANPNYTFKGDERMDLNPVIAVKRQNLAYLLSRRNVVACGVGFKVTDEGETDEPCVVVSVTRKMPEAQLASADIVPKKLGEVKTDVVETGVIRALQSHKDRWRPAPGGVSIGHILVTAGTLGCLVTRNGELFILSNNHVLANSNAAQQGDSIIQPGRYDGGNAADQIATLEDFVPINFGTSPATCSVATGLESFLNWLARLLGSSHRVMAFQQVPGRNLVDAAIARPLSDDLIDKQIFEIGLPKGTREATLGTQVKKSGRTTGFTTGRITQIDVTTQVSYGEGQDATFEDQLMAGGMSKGGDSGSAVLDEEDFVVGLLFAGSDTTTIINPIQFVLDALNVEIAV